ncbi:predicted protein [Streptomyces viridosporus ATCC 14672]|uniref:Predicted protein n=1 Tax=Streptomyces viridosporus (strain ATCC 14672 / DSM 40746 / JCM 4963 / KCTC 9882 / NRRL B-12104 / FH 1290) TaxID=566461 RepID=D6A231_STRV1|nr:predicted protein [Streptomyces viridosporus ATCC 14672]
MLWGHGCSSSRSRPPSAAVLFADEQSYEVKAQENRRRQRHTAFECRARPCG